MGLNLRASLKYINRIIERAKLQKTAPEMKLGSKIVWHIFSRLPGSRDGLLKSP
jgi:hypothetical protein